MIIKYNKGQLSRIIDDIFILTGISISVLDTSYNTIATSTRKQNYCLLLQTIENEQKHCARCDKEILNLCCNTKRLERHICRAGLYDSAMPIMKYDTVVGFVIMGQVRSVDSPAIPQYAPHIDSETLVQLNQLYEKIPFIPQNRLESLYDLLPRILFDSAIDFVYDSSLIEILKFIDANLQADLSIKLLCEKFYISKNRLYEVFRNNLGCTITGYINEQRIKLAKELLKQSNATVYSIAEAVGIRNYTYFCKLFKKLNKVTPTEYRKNIESFI